MATRSAALFGASLLLALTLTGCVASSSGFEVLEREATAADALPSGLPDYSTDRLMATSSRFITEHDGNSLYLARSADDESVCLVIYASAEEWISGCGSTGREFGLGGPMGNYVVLPSAADAPDGVERLSDNLYAVS